MRKLIVVLTSVMFAATCLAQGRGGVRGSSGGGFRRGQAYSGRSFARGIVGRSVGFGFGSYSPWYYAGGYYPSYYDYGYDAYGYYAVPVRGARYVRGPARRVYAPVRVFIADGHWHRFGRR